MCSLFAIAELLVTMRASKPQHLLEASIYLRFCVYYMVIHKYRTPSFQWHNLVNIRFISIKISMSERQTMLCEVLSEFLQYLLPLPCNVCISVTSEHRQGDSVTVSHNYPSIVV